ncbi:Bidirectional sugar transporter sweet14 [Ancistrocladus abbreviatus]
MATFMSLIHHLPWITIFGLLGNTISFMVYLSPIPTFYRIYKRKSTEGFQCLPYVVALFSAMLWILYAFFDTDSTFLVTINSFGCFIETLYIALFLFYATKEARIFTVKLIMLLNVVGFGFIIFVVLVIAKTSRLRLRILGWICLIFSLCVFVAPLCVMRQVIRTKSVKYMPFLLSFFLTISAVMWFFYGLLKKDCYVAIPNVLGFSFGILQMVLYAIYRNSKEIIISEEDPKGQKLPVPISELTSDQIIEAVKLSSINVGGQEINSVDLPAVTVNNNDGIYAIEIHNVHDPLDDNNKITLEIEPAMVAAMAAPPVAVAVPAVAVVV